MLRRYPFILIVLCVCAGVMLDDGIRFRDFPGGWFLAGAGVCLAAAWVIRRWSRWAALVLLGAGLVLGASVYSHWRRTFPPEHVFFHYRRYIGEPVFVRGVIVSDVSRRSKRRGPRMTFELAVEGVGSLMVPAGVYPRESGGGDDNDGIGGDEKGVDPCFRRDDKEEVERDKIIETPYSGRVLVQMYRRADLHYGDEVVLHGKLHRPYDFVNSRKFSYRRYLMRKKLPLILSVRKTALVRRTGVWRGHHFLRAVYRLRNHLKTRLAAHLPADKAGIMQAVLLGERTSIPSDIRETFNSSGTSHVLAISGLHIGIISCVFLFLARQMPLSLRGQYVLVMVLLIGYVPLTGARPSVIRAVLTACLFLTSFMIEREALPLNSLAAAAFLILAGEPMMLFDIGFQLSFVSVLCILLIYPIIKDALFSRFPRLKTLRGLNFVVSSLIVSASAWLGSSGLILYHFEKWTPAALIANLFAVPLIAVSVGLGFSLLAADAVSAGLAGLAAKALGVTLSGLLWLTSVFSRIPGGCIRIKNIKAWNCWCYYIVLLLLILMARGWRSRRGEQKNTPSR